MAVTLTVPDLQAAVGGLDTERATRLLPVVRTLVERYAPGAPEALQNEAAIRCAGWLFQSMPGPIRRTAALSTSVSYARERSALRDSGGMALLAPYRIKRAL